MPESEEGYQESYINNGTIATIEPSETPKGGGVLDQVAKIVNDIPPKDNVSVRPLHFLEKNPQIWVKAAREQIKKTLSHSEKPMSESEGREVIEKRWKELSGVDAKDSTLTIIMPLHNEAAFLPSILGTISLATIPDSADIQFVFVTNNCTDDGATVKVLHNYLQNIGSLEQRNVAKDTESGVLPQINDQGFNQTYSKTQRNNISFVHLDTATAGKANALSVGNSLAVEHGDVAMCLDGNDFPEPDAIAKLYGTAYQHIEDAKDNVVIVSGNGVGVFKDAKGSLLAPLLKKVEVAHREFGMQKDIVVRAGFFAWDTHFVQELGGFPPTSYEGFSLAARAIARGKEVTHNEDARSPKYGPKGKDAFNLGARIVRGSLQTVNQYPDTKKLVEEKVHYMKSWTDRLKSLFSKIRQHPLQTPFYFTSFALWEIMRFQGRKEYQNKPDVQTWEAQKTKQ